MQDWNVVVSVPEHGFKQTREFLGAWGPVRRTEFYNVLVMRIDDIPAFLAGLQQRVMENPDVQGFLGRVVPITDTFVFQSPEEFEAKARDAVTAYLSHLSGKRFHVRMHRRGFKGRLSSQEEERFLDVFLLESLAQQGTPGRVAFDDPDAIIALETVGQQAGLSLWTRQDLQRYPFLKLD
jgi:tRNA(Ser,Leu) C12 N-acetylase TAN1